MVKNRKRKAAEPSEAKDKACLGEHCPWQLVQHYGIGWMSDFKIANGVSVLEVTKCSGKHRRIGSHRLWGCKLPRPLKTTRLGLVVHC